MSIVREVDVTRYYDLADQGIDRAERAFNSTDSIVDCDELLDNAVDLFNEAIDSLEEAIAAFRSYPEESSIAISGNDPVPIIETGYALLARFEPCVAQYDPGPGTPQDPPEPSDPEPADPGHGQDPDLDDDPIYTLEEQSDGLGFGRAVIGIAGLGLLGVAVYGVTRKS